MWVEPKIDGSRVFLCSGTAINGVVQPILVTKHNGIYTSVDFPELFQDIFRCRPLLTPGNIFDCELVKKTQKLYIFDILFREQESIRSRSLQARQAFLYAYIPLNDTDKAGVFRLADFGALVQSPFEEIKGLYEFYLKRGFEGAVVKDPNARYGATRAWLKLKNDATIDCFVHGIHKSEKGEDVYELAVAEAGSIPASHWILGSEVHFAYTHIADCYSAIASVDKSHISVGTVLEVRYQPTEGFRRLRHPTIQRIRLDKTAQECTIDQVPWIRND